MTDHAATDERYIPVEEVAARLGLPLPVLISRVEAGDVPSRRVEDESGVHYALRLSDLGIELDESPTTSAGTGAVFDESEANGVESAIASAFNAGAAPPQDVEDASLPSVAVTGRRVDSAGVDAAAVAAADTGARAEAPVSGATIRPEADEPEGPEATEAEMAVPPPHFRRSELTLLEAVTPRGELSSMSLDARELVAGLLDRWEHTLERRIYTEQRQRFQGELWTRQNMVKQLQMELQAVRAENAAAQAEKDRVLAEKERELADRERALDEARRLAEQAERHIAPAASARRRRWFRHRSDG